MTRSQIEYILALEQHKNFGRAADACFVTQSTLSALVAKFEETCGVLLFNRKTRPISVTAQGEIIIRSLKNISREYNLLDETINTLKGKEVGALSLACIPTVAPYVYPLILDQLSDLFSEVHFSIYEFTTERITEGLIAGEIDLGIISTPLEHPQLIEYPLYTEEFVVYDCGVKTNTAQYSISDIDLNRLWLMEEGHCLRNQVGKICELKQQNLINGNLTYNCGSIFTLIEMVKKNKGITLIPRLSVQENPQLLEHNIYEFSGIKPARTIGLVTHRNFNKSKILNQIKKIIQKTITAEIPEQKKDVVSIAPY